MDLQGLRAVSKARDLEEKRLTDKRRNALTLILRHLLDFGYVDSYERLSTECGVSLNKVQAVEIPAGLQCSLICHDSHACPACPWIGGRC